MFSSNFGLSSRGPMLANGNISPQTRMNSFNQSIITGKGQKSQHIQYPEEILQLLDAVWAPKEVVIMQCKGHQKAVTPEAKGNRKADKEAKWAALGSLPESSIKDTKAACAVTLLPDALCSKLLSK
ncbi:Gag-Pol polyprotein [Plecturocebus cupreus]